MSWSWAAAAAADNVAAAAEHLLHIVRRSLALVCSVATSHQPPYAPVAPVPVLHILSAAPLCGVSRAVLPLQTGGPGGGTRSTGDLDCRCRCRCRRWRWCGHRCPRSADTAASLTPYKVIDTRPRNVSRPAGGSWRHGDMETVQCTGGHWGH